MKNVYNQIYFCEVWIWQVHIYMNKYRVVNKVKPTNSYFSYFSLCSSVIYPFILTSSFMCPTMSWHSLCCVTLVSIFHSWLQCHIENTLWIISHVNSESSFKSLHMFVRFGLWWIFRWSNWLKSPISRSYIEGGSMLCHSRVGGITGRNLRGNQCKRRRKT
jgi:hypothetical protein